MMIIILVHYYTSNTIATSCDSDYLIYTVPALQMKTLPTTIIHYYIHIQDVQSYSFSVAP